MKVRYLIFVFYSFMLSGTCIAQSDVTSWIGADVKYDLNKHWSAGLETQTRTDLKLGRLETAYLSPSICWEVHKYLEVGSSYRLSSIPYSKSTTNRAIAQRFTLDLTFRNIEKLFKKKSRIDASLRVQATTEHQLEKRTENTLRLKFKVEYNLPKTKLDLFVSTELFYRYQRDLIYTFMDVQSVDAINKYRIMAGLSYPIGDRQNVKLFGLNQWRYPDGRSEFVIGLGYSFDLSPQKKTSKTTN